MDKWHPLSNFLFSVQGANGLILWFHSIQAVILKSSCIKSPPGGTKGCPEHCAIPSEHPFSSQLSSYLHQTFRGRISEVSFSSLSNLLYFLSFLRDPAPCYPFWTSIFLMLPHCPNLSDLWILKHTDLWILKYRPADMEPYSSRILIWGLLYQDNLG